MGNGIIRSLSWKLKKLPTLSIRIRISVSQRWKTENSNCHEILPGPATNWLPRTRRGIEIHGRWDRISPLDAFFFFQNSFPSEPRQAKRTHRGTCTRTKRYNAIWNDITAKRCRYFWNYGNQRNGGLSPTDTLGCNSSVPRGRWSSLIGFRDFEYVPRKNSLDIARDFSNFPRAIPLFPPFFPPSFFNSLSLSRSKSTDEPPFGKLPSSHDARNRCGLDVCVRATIHPFHSHSLDPGYLSLFRFNDVL